MGNKLKNFNERVNKSGNAIFYFSTLLVIFVILNFALFAHQGNVLIDCGREAYIPEQILKGNVLFKDIFILYGPLSYQINAFLYNLFGIHLNTLYFAGIANSLLILSVFYLIARKVTSIKTSWLACYLLMVTSIFYYHISSYIFPYSYAVIYAISSFLIAVLLCMYYVEKSKPVFLILSAMFMGISFACKIDFVPFALALFLIAVYFKPLGGKNLALFGGAFLLVPAVSWGILFLKGLQVSDVIYYLQMMNDFVNSHLFKFFYSENTGLFPTHKFLWALAKVSGVFFYNFAVAMLVFYTFFLAVVKLPEFRGKLVLQVGAFIGLYLVFPKIFFRNIGEITSLGWIAVGTAVILAVFLIHLFCKNRLKEIDLKDKFFILIAVAGLIAACKSFFFIHLQVFGTYLMPLLILTCLVFLFDKIPSYLNFLNEKAWKQACFMVLFLTGIIYLLFNLNFGLKGNSYLLETDRGKIYTADFLGVSLDKLITYINKIPSKSTFMMLPEGLMINFLTAHDSNNRFYSLTPNFVEAFESEIIQHINFKKPDYVFITNQDTEDYGFRYFGKNYGKEIYNCVKSNYKYVERIKPPSEQKNSLWVDIYKMRHLE